MKSLHSFILLIILFMFSLLMPSCINAKGNGWSITAVGNDAEKLSVTPEGLEVTKLDQSKGLGVVGKFGLSSWRSFLAANVIQYISGKYYDAQGNELNKATTIELEKLRNAKSAAEAEAAFKTLQETNRAAEVAAGLAPKA